MKKIILTNPASLRLLRVLGRINVFLLLVCVAWLGVMSLLMDEDNHEKFISSHYFSFSILMASYWFDIVFSLCLMIYSSYLFIWKGVAVDRWRAVLHVWIIPFFGVGFVLGWGLALREDGESVFS